MHTKHIRIKLYDCEHGIQRSQCMEECGGGSICDHGKQRSQCMEGCGGDSICDLVKVATMQQEGESEQVELAFAAGNVAKQAGNLLDVFAEYSADLESVLSVDLCSVFLVNCSITLVTMGRYEEADRLACAELNLRGHAHSNVRWPCTGSDT